MIPQSTLTYINPNHLLLELPPDTLDRLWQQSQSFCSKTSRWQAYRNLACMSAFLPWLQEIIPTAKVWPNREALSSFWEVVNGVCICDGNSVNPSRLVLISTDNVDLCELRVPQEWVDLPSWAGDYYLGVQFNPDECYVRVFGYASHKQLKEKAIYDVSERVYCVDEEDLVPDLDVLWVAQQLGLRETLHEEIAPLPLLAVAQAENLIERLGNPSVIWPRLEVSFSVWGALLEHGAWRQSLYNRRLGITEPWSVTQWLRDGISQVASQAGWHQLELEPNLTGSRGSQSQSSSVMLSRRLTINGNLYELRIVPLNSSWRFELRSYSGLIPTGFKLRLLTEDLSPFENNEDVATNPTEVLYIEVAIDPGEGLVWEIEPQPDNYEREILRI